MEIEFLEITRPILQFEVTTLETHNSKATVDRKQWQPVIAKVDGKYSKKIGVQLALQMAVYEDDNRSHSEYKFDIKVGDFLLKGCWLQHVDYSKMDMTDPDHFEIELTIQYDNVIYTTT